MKDHLFHTLTPLIVDNDALREPQREGFAHIVKHFANANAEREVGIVLPVGCGKSGLITLSPFATRATRALVIAPGTRIASQLLADFDYNNPGMFYRKCHIIDGDTFPEAAEIRGRDTNIADLEEADVVITNIQQVQGDENRWLAELGTASKEISSGEDHQPERHSHPR